MTSIPNETYGGPFFVPDVPADENGITTAQAARALSHPGFDAKQASDLWHNRLRAGQLTPYNRQRSGRRAHLFRSDQILTAAIYQRMSECGFQGSEPGDAFHAAFLALTAWNTDDLGDNPKPAPRPSAWVFRGYLSGARNFGFELISMRNTKGRGDLKFAARVRHYDFESNNSVGTNFWNPGPTWERRSLFALELDPIMAHLTREKPVVN